MPYIKKVLETPWFYVEEEEFADKKVESPFYRFVAPPGVIIFTVTPENRIVIVKQFRPALREITLEVPAGQVDEGEELVSTATRELYEETGYRAKTVDIISPKLYPLPNRSPSGIYIFLAKDAVRDEAFEPKENIETLTVSSEEFEDWIKKGKIQFMGSIVAFLFWKMSLKNKF